MVRTSRRGLVRVRNVVSASFQIIPRLVGGSVRVGLRSGPHVVGR